MSPTQLTLRHLRTAGYTASIVERWNQFARCRQDLFGFIDLVAIKSTENGVLGVQTTSASNVSSRIKKAQQNANLSVWLDAGNRFVVHGWAKRGPRGKRKTYQLREVLVTEKRVGNIPDQTGENRERSDVDREGVATHIRAREQVTREGSSC